MKKAVIILSGGLDSACMMSYLKKGYQLYGVTFAYGQRASQEIKAAKRIAKLLKLKEHKILDISFMKNCTVKVMFLLVQRKRCQKNSIIL